MSVPDLLQVLRGHDPEAPALSLLTGLREEFRWNYRQLLQTALGFRRALQAAGAAPGTCVCLIAGNCPQFVALMLACVDLGAAFAPVHADQATATLTGILRELRPVLVIVDEEVSDKVLRGVLRATPKVWRLRLRRTPWLRPVLSRVAQRQVMAPADPGASSVGTDVPVLILHSSGSTGSPKVIEYSRWRLNVFLHWQRRLFEAFPDAADGAAPSPRVNALPLAHFGGLSFVLQALLDGRLVHLPCAIAPYDYLLLAARAGCQLLMLVPALYEALLGDAAGSLPPSRLRYCLTMGEAATPELLALVKRVLSVQVYAAYGMSEGLSGLSHHGADTAPGSCGRLLFGEAKLVDGDASRDEDKEGEEGELWVRNDTTFPCYRDPALNAAKFAGGWYRTGDRFRRDAQGHYYFLGRVDAMCVVNGRNVYPADLEQVFMRHPDVVDCMAAVLTLAKGRKRLGVLVCLRPESRATPAALSDWFLEYGALHAAPAWIMLGKGVPRSPAGKRDRLAVAGLLQQDYQQCLRKVS